MLRRLPDVEWVAKGVNSEDACRIAAEVAPDVMLLDISMPGGGIEAAQNISASHPAVRIILLTACDNDELVTAGLAAGVSGYVVKGVASNELFDAIKSVHAGRPYVSPDLATRILINRLQKPKVAECSPPASHVPLSAREREMLELLYQGLSNRQIAERLDLAVPTVKNQMSGIFRKIGVTSRTQAIAARPMK